MQSNLSHNFHPYPHDPSLYKAQMKCELELTSHVVLRGYFRPL